MISFRSALVLVLLLCISGSAVALPAGTSIIYGGQQKSPASSLAGSSGAGSSMPKYPVVGVEQDITSMIGGASSSGSQEGSQGELLGEEGSVSEQQGSSVVVIERSYGWPGSGTAESWQVGQAWQTGGYGLWVRQGAAGRAQHHVAAAGGSVPLIAYAPLPGPVKIYDLCEADGMLTATSSSLNLPAGLSDGSYNAQIPGRHMLF
ncbi:MAG: hypothetical protein QUS07_01405, partial [Methanothrix sp.]|nr:hypothetical protein [Methanothrix sp.]